MVSEMILAARSSHSTAEWWVRFLHGISIVIVLVSAICAVSFAGYAQNSRQQLTVQAAKPLNSLTVEYGKTRKLYDLMQRYADRGARSQLQIGTAKLFNDFKSHYGAEVEDLNRLRIEQLKKLPESNVKMDRMMIADQNAVDWLKDRQDDLQRLIRAWEAQNRQQVDARYQWEEFERDNGVRLGFSLNELRLNAWTNVIDEKTNRVRIGDTDLRKWLVDQSARLQKMIRLWEQHP